MKKPFTYILILLSLNVLGQKNTSGETESIVDEGKLLYKSEKASWAGTDLFLENYKNKENIGGYISYIDKDIAKCIFFSKAENPKVIGTISFDSTYNNKLAKINLSERDFTQNELDLYLIRKITLDEMIANTDSFFKFYENTNPNLIPIINGQEKKVYILTGPQKSGVVVFGNDYLLTFDKNNNLISKKQLHKNIIPIECRNDEKNKGVEDAMHSHLPETGSFITATDICTLMLYEKYANWKTHSVISEEYLNIWNCETHTLTVIPTKSKEKTNNNKGKRNKKKKKE